MKNILSKLVLVQLGMGVSVAMASSPEDHSKELLGKFYKKSVVSLAQGELKGRDLRFKSMVQILENRLPKKWTSKAQVIAQTIEQEAARHKMDPFFLMAVMDTESSFNPEQIGGVGEIGLMQIRPSTAAWLIKKSEFKAHRALWKGAESLKNPIVNIRIGAAYFQMLRRKFGSHSRLYLAAYNMGPTNVRRALKREIVPVEYPAHVMKNYLSLYRAQREETADRRLASLQ